MAISIISHPDCALHEMGEHHPESPARLSAIQDQLLSSGLDLLLQHHDAPPATRKQLCRVHDPEYVEHIFHSVPEQGYFALDQDTSMNPYTLSAALHAAGAIVLGVDLVMTRKTSAVFCNVRPPGHHAEHNRAMGFCIFNNIAVGAAHALQQYNLERVAIVDFDVHYGNGTEDIVKYEPKILFCSTFQNPLYPHVDTENASDNIVNAPLPPGANGKMFREAVHSHWLPKLEAFKPELILVSAGFDAHIEDDMSDLRLQDQDFAWVTSQIKNVADKYADGRIVSTLEGGYALSALGRCVAEHIKALIG
jgi:acetoin utilization deacetylase AcuC-like enzyme